MSKVVEICKEVVKNATSARGKILHGTDARVVVSSTWARRNIEREVTVNSTVNHILEWESTDVFTSPGIDSTSELLSKHSPSLNLFGVFRDVKGKKKEKTVHLEVWKKNLLWKNWDLSQVEIHGDVYTDGEFGCFEWSPCETKVLYVAEKKRPKNEPFFPLTRKPDVSYGTEYVYVEDWGETLVGKSCPVVVSFDLSSEEPHVVCEPPEGLCFGSAIWAPDGGVVCVAWETEPRRLGKVYCTNRKSSIVHISPEGKLTTLTTGDKSVWSPRFTPDGAQLVWLERPCTPPHCACNQLVKCDWTTRKLTVVVTEVASSMKTSNGEQFYGLFCDSIKGLWLNNHCLILNSLQRASIRSYVVDIDANEIFDLTGCSSSDETYSQTVYDVRDNLILAGRSSLLETDSLWICRYSKSEPLKWVNIVAGEPTLDDYLVDVMRLEAQPDLGPITSFSSIYLGPVKAAGVPLIVFPHGGPHSSYANSYSFSATLFARCGFAVLLVNYRGSTGHGQASVDFLLGKVGTSDVFDCHQSTMTALKKYSANLDPNKCVLFGGSHGGFLVLHLAGQYPSVYKAVAARNPVVDIASLFSSSDIPDWAFAESGVEYSSTAVISSELYKGMKQKSPISYIDYVTAPVLLLMGVKDLRVPPAQGFAYHKHLKARGTKTKLLAYEDNHGLRQTPHEIDFIINTILWFNEHIPFDN